MADQWHYAQKGERLGPVSEEQLRQMVQSGQLQPNDLVWKEGMAQWMPAGQTLDVFPAAAPSPPGAPPPLPPRPAFPAQPDFARLKENRQLLGFLGALAVVVIAVFLPWVSVSVGGSTLMGKDFPGIRSTWGVLALLVAVGGITFGLLNPAGLLKSNAKYAMAGVGGLIALLTIIYMAQLPSTPAVPMVDFSAGAGFGAYLSLLAGVGAAVLGFMTDWEKPMWK